MHNNEETKALNVFMESTLAITALRNLHYLSEIKPFSNQYLIPDKACGMVIFTAYQCSLQQEIKRVTLCFHTANSLHWQATIAKFLKRWVFEISTEHYEFQTLFLIPKTAADKTVTSYLVAVLELLLISHELYC